MKKKEVVQSGQKGEARIWACLFLEEVYDGVRLGEHVEEVELRDGLAVGHGNALL